MGLRASQRCLRSLVALLLVFGVGATAAPTAFAQVFTYTGAEQSYTVPAGVTVVHVIAVGAPGGGGTQVTGGRGAVVAADLQIPLGQTVLYLDVGGTGVGGTAVGGVTCAAGPVGGAGCAVVGGCGWGWGVGTCAATSAGTRGPVPPPT